LAGVVFLHLADGTGDFWPQQVNLLVQAAQGEGAQGWVWLGEEPNDAGSRGEANHRGRAGDGDRSAVSSASSSQSGSERQLLRKLVEGDGAVLWRLRVGCDPGVILGLCGAEMWWAAAVKEGREGEVAWVMVEARCRCCYVRGTLRDETRPGELGADVLGITTISLSTTPHRLVHSSGADVSAMYI
jgi:hypothetical protein